MSDLSQKIKILFFESFHDSLVFFERFKISNKDSENLKKKNKINKFLV